MKLYFIGLMSLLFCGESTLADNLPKKETEVAAPIQSFALKDINGFREDLQKTSISYDHPFYTHADSLKLSSKESFKMKLDRITSSPVFQMTYIGVPLIAGGLLMKSEDNKFRSLRNEYLPSFQHHYDDYLQFFPAVAMIGMKIGGVEGRSSWSRMLTSDAFSTAIMAITVNSLKSSAKEMRPDGSNNKSFPSGHTATAFMAATMMHKEYGFSSPWYSIGAYSVATITGITRELNNKHWMSDIMVGAGIGILSTKFGYYLADLLFKDKGITHPYLANTSIDRFRNPSFLGLYLGFNSLIGKYKLSDGSSLTASNGSKAGLEGAWFINPYFGIGGNFSVASMQLFMNKELQNEPLDVLTSSVGSYFSYPFSARWSVGSKLLVGYSHYSKCTLPSEVVGGTGGLSLGTGCSMNYLLKQNLGIKFFLDYSLLPSFIPANNNFNHSFSLGGSANIVF